jgi:hypothetical protein
MEYMRAKIEKLPHPNPLLQRGRKTKRREIFLRFALKSSLKGRI